MKVNFIQGTHAEHVKQTAQRHIGKIIKSKLARGEAV